MLVIFFLDIYFVSSTQWMVISPTACLITVPSIHMSCQPFQDMDLLAALLIPRMDDSKLYSELPDPPWFDHLELRLANLINLISGPASAQVICNWWFASQQIININWWDLKCSIPYPASEIGIPKHQGDGDLIIIYLVQWILTSNSKLFSSLGSDFKCLDSLVCLSWP